ncbi:MAG: hypothetical protein QXE01_05040 [Sulfolobales archaeon]
MSEMEILVFDIAKPTTVPWRAAAAVVNGSMMQVDVYADAAEQISRYIESFTPVKVSARIESRRVVELLSEPEPVPLEEASAVISSAKLAVRMLIQPPKAGIIKARVGEQCYIVQRRMSTTNLMILFNDLMSFLGTVMMSRRGNGESPWIHWVSKLYKARTCSEDGIDVITNPMLGVPNLIIPYVFIDFTSILRKADAACGGCWDKLLEDMEAMMPGGENLVRSLRGGSAAKEEAGKTLITKIE